MNNIKSKSKNAKDKVVGKTKETVGKITGNESLELKGKVQSSKSRLKDKAHEAKEKVAGEINDFIDEKE